MLWVNASVKGIHCCRSGSQCCAGKCCLGICCGSQCCSTGGKCCGEFMAMFRRWVTSRQINHITQVRTVVDQAHHAVVAPAADQERLVAAVSAYLSFTYRAIITSCSFQLLHLEWEVWKWSLFQPGKYNIIRPIVSIPSSLLAAAVSTFIIDWYSS